MRLKEKNIQNPYSYSVKSKQNKIDYSFEKFFCVCPLFFSKINRNADLLRKQNMNINWYTVIKVMTQTNRQRKSRGHTEIVETGWLKIIYSFCEMKLDNFWKILWHICSIWMMISNMILVVCENCPLNDWNSFHVCKQIWCPILGHILCILGLLFNWLYGSLTMLWFA